MAEYTQQSAAALTALSTFEGDVISPLRGDLSVAITTTGATGTPAVKFQQSLDNTNWDFVRNAAQEVVEVQLIDGTRVVNFGFMRAKYFRVVGSANGDAGTLNAIKFYWE